MFDKFLGDVIEAAIKMLGDVIVKAASGEELNEEEKANLLALGSGLQKGLEMPDIGTMFGMDAEQVGEPMPVGDARFPDGSSVQVIDVTPTSVPSSEDVAPAESEAPEGNPYGETLNPIDADSEIVEPPVHPGESDDKASK